MRAVLADKARIGHTDQIRELLRKYGADRLSAVDPKHYEALLRDVEDSTMAASSHAILSASSADRTCSNMWGCQTVLP